MTGGDTIDALRTAWRADIDHGLQDALMTMDNGLATVAHAGVPMDSPEDAGIIRPSCRQVIDHER